MAVNICTDIHGTQRVNPNDFARPLTSSRLNGITIFHHQVLGCLVTLLYIFVYVLIVDSRDRKWGKGEVG